MDRTDFEVAGFIIGNFVEFKCGDDVPHLTGIGRITDVRPTPARLQDLTKIYVRIIDATECVGRECFFYPYELRLLEGEELVLRLLAGA